MIKYVDTVSRYIYPLINKYLVAVFIMRDNDVYQRTLANNFYVFLNCSNPRHVKHEDILPERTIVSNVPTPLVLYHTPVRFSLS